MLNTQKLAPNLLNIIDEIENDRIHIASAWVGISKVKSIFASYGISTKKFRDGFGIPIIEYFISVVREEKSAGDCPIMSKLVKYLLDKNITPKDVFDICMGFRRTLISHLFNRAYIKDNALEMMNEIADLFDANLSGVLDIFTTFYQQQQKIIHDSSIHQKKFTQISKIINFIDTKIFIIQNGRVIVGNKAFFDTLGVKDIKSLYKRYKDGFSYMKTIDSSSKYFDLDNIDIWLNSVIDENKPFKADIYNAKYSKTITYSGRITTLPDSYPTQYIITLSSIDTYIKEQHQIEDSLTHDTLTGLHNYTKFHQIMIEEQKKAVESSRNLALVIVNIPSLGELNKLKGFEAGDDLIIEVSKEIKSLINASMFLARLEGSSFGVLMPYESEQECYDWCNTLLMQLNKKDERKTVSVTAFDLAETVNRAQMRAYDLVDIANSSEDNDVRTDFDNVQRYDKLLDQEKFTDRLKSINELSTAMYYKGLPITSKNKVIHVDDNSAVIALSKKQLSVAKYINPIYLEIPSFGFVKAHIYNINYEKMIVTIHKFRLDRHSPLQRKRFRIEVIDDISVSLVSGGPISEGVLLDMNNQSLAIKIKRKKNLDDGALVSVYMMLLIDNKLISFYSNATIQRIEKIKDAYKVVVLCSLDVENKKILNDYLAKRQMEAIQELRKNNFLF